MNRVRRLMAKLSAAYNAPCPALDVNGAYDFMDEATF